MKKTDNRVAYEKAFLEIGYQVDEKEISRESCIKLILKLKKRFGGTVNYERNDMKQDILTLAYKRSSITIFYDLIAYVSLIWRVNGKRHKDDYWELV
jgi:hypothetical protein